RRRARHFGFFRTSQRRARRDIPLLFSPCPAANWRRDLREQGSLQVSSGFCLEISNTDGTCGVDGENWNSRSPDCVLEFWQRDTSFGAAFMIHPYFCLV